MHHTIITIGRQFGSGGRYIGKMIADTLGIPFYDRDLIVLASEKSGVSQQVLEGVDETATNPFLYSFTAATFAPGGRVSGPAEISINDQLFFAQADIIKKAAQESSCVIVGRCADYILREREDCVNVFIHAPLDARAERAVTFYGIQPEHAKNTIRKMDKKRSGYYNYYTNQNWADMGNYDLSINSTTLGIEKTADVIIDFAKSQK